MDDPSAKALQLHAQACKDKQAGYIDPDTGFFVMTSWYLSGRKACCGNGCRHCPWPKDAQKKAGRPDVPAFPWPE